MSDPIEICMNISGHIIAKTKGQFPTFQFWHAVDKILSSCTSVELYIADQQPPAFVSVNIHCIIPSESYSRAATNSSASEPQPVVQKGFGQSTHLHELDQRFIDFIGSEFRIPIG